VGILLDALRKPAAYVPVDIAAEWLAEAAARVAAVHRGLRVLPVTADFTQPFALPPSLPANTPRLGFFPGSTIGNFAPDAAVGFLAAAHRVLGDGAGLLVGADVVKDPAVLEAAYDDAAGVTARFNLNLLARLNRECGADFELSAFRHRALWNEAEERVEMHLISLRAQTVTVAGCRIRFAAGETIHTENSHKYRPEGFAALARGPAGTRSGAGPIRRGCSPSG
jgi:dimethylhistidine N-methyltransferase